MEVAKDLGIIKSDIVAWWRTENYLEPLMIGDSMGKCPSCKNTLYYGGWDLDELEVMFLITFCTEKCNRRKKFYLNQDLKKRKEILKCLALESE